MSDKDIMLRLPEVAYFVEKIPIARVVIKPTAVHLRFFQHARDSGLSFRAQCEAFNIPWHARKVPEASACKPVLKASRILSASVFGRTFPEYPQRARQWAENVIRAKTDGLSEHAIQWVAEHGAKISGTVLRTCTAYLLVTKSLPAATPVEAVLERTRKLAERSDRRNRDQIAAAWVGIDIAQRNVFEDFRGNIVRSMQIGRNRFDEARSFAIQRPQNLPADNSPLTYPETLRAEHAGLVIEPLRTAEQFTAVGKEMGNCIRGAGAMPGSMPAFVVETSERNYFAYAKLGRCHIAVVRRGQKAIAAVEYLPGWTTRSVLGPRNAVSFDPDVFQIVEMLRQKALEPTVVAAPVEPQPQASPAEEWSDSSDRVRRLYPLGGFLSRVFQWSPPT